MRLTNLDKLHKHKDEAKCLESADLFLTKL